MTTSTQEEPLKKWLDKNAPDRIRTVWKSVSVERFMHVAFQAIYVNPELQKCSGFSVLNALVKCAQHNLEPDGRMAYLVPFAQNDKSGKFDPLQLRLYPRLHGHGADLPAHRPDWRHPV